jgi:hypothetical protein
VKVLLAAVSVPVLAVPAVGWLPDQVPEAVHAVALVDDQFRLELPPLATLVGLALKVTVGAGVGVELLEPPPPHAATAIANSNAVARITVITRVCMRR